MSKILIVATSAETLKNGVSTGLWLEELAAPYYLFKDAGYEVDIATPKGGKTPLDPNSIAADALTDIPKKFYHNTGDMGILNNAHKLSSVKDLSAYKAVFIPGGHGAVVDLPDNPDVQRVLIDFTESGKVVGSVCHGPVAFNHVKLSNGDFLAKGKKVTGFSNTEEKTVGKVDAVPWSLEDELKKEGADYSKKGDWEEYVVVDGKLVTGQNPMSSRAVGEAILKVLKSA